jgi:hypothetical protein
MKMNNNLLLRQNEDQFAIEEQVQTVQVRRSNKMQEFTDYLVDPFEIIRKELQLK